MILIIVKGGVLCIIIYALYYSLSTTVIILDGSDRRGALFIACGAFCTLNPHTLDQPCHSANV